MATLVVSGALVAPAAATPVPDVNESVPEGLLCDVPPVSDRCERWKANFRHSDPGHLVTHPEGEMVFSAAYAWDEHTERLDAFVSAWSSDGSPAWSLWYGGQEVDEAPLRPRALDISDDGSRLCVTGSLEDDPDGQFPIPSGMNMGLVCYAPDTGQRLWSVVHDAPEARWRYGETLATATVPFEVDGETVPRDVVFVTGTDEAAPLEGPVNDKNFVTVAFDAGGGSVLWVATYNGPANGFDVGGYVDVSSDGRRVFVTGISTGDPDATPPSGQDYATVAYDAATGTELWVSRYDGPGSEHAPEWLLGVHCVVCPVRAGDVAHAKQVSPDGSVVVVTGRSLGEDGPEYATVAIDAEDGSIRWEQRYDSPKGPDAVPGSVRVYPYTIEAKGSGDEATALAFDPAGERVYVTGTARNYPAGPAYTTIAYDVETGDEVWVATYNGPAGRVDGANAIAVAPSGDRIYVTGRSSDPGMRCHGCPQSDTTGYAFDDIATVAYDRDGNEVWVARFSAHAYTDIGTAVAVDPEADRVYVSGRSLGRDEFGNFFSEFVLLAYDG